MHWQMREISNGGGMSGNSLDACFGLGDAEVIDRIQIEWPLGIVQEFTNVPVDQFLAVTEPSRIALSCTIRPDGAVVLTVTADPEQSVAIYGSEDLTTWTEVAPSTGGGEVLIVEPTTGIQFFKAQAAP